MKLLEITYQIYSDLKMHYNFDAQRELEERELRDKIHIQRSVVIVDRFNAKESLRPFVQVPKEPFKIVEDNSITYQNESIQGGSFIKKVDMPLLVDNIDQMDIHYFGAHGYGLPFSRIPFHRFVSLEKDRFGSRIPCYSVMDRSTVLIKNYDGEYIFAIGLFSNPENVPGYDLQTSEYPADLRAINKIILLVKKDILATNGLLVDPVSDQFNANERNAPPLSSNTQIPQAKKE